MNEYYQVHDQDFKCLFLCMCICMYFTSHCVYADVCYINNFLQYVEVVLKVLTCIILSFQAEHCMPTLKYGEDCTTLGSPYIGNCNFDGAGAALTTIYGGAAALNAPVQMVAANLFSFSQKPYISGIHTSLGDYSAIHAVVYIFFNLHVLCVYILYV